MTKQLRWEDIDITHIRGSGPGGQNRNKRMTGIRLFHRPTGLVAKATERRSQNQNLANAWERLSEKLQRLFRKPTPRIETKVSKRQKQNRLHEKKKRSKTKVFRHRNVSDDLI